jgi:hypothetical protein
LLGTKQWAGTESVWTNSNATSNPDPWRTGLT